MNAEDKKFNRLETITKDKSRFQWGIIKELSEASKT
jgi:hypothetical protein